MLGARVLAEFGDDKTRYADARARTSRPAPRTTKPPHGHIISKIYKPLLDNKAYGMSSRVVRMLQTPDTELPGRAAELSKEPEAEDFGFSIFG